MTLPFSTTTIAIRRPPTVDANGDSTDPYDDPLDPVTVATGIRARIGAGTGTPVREGANRMELHQQLHADPCDLRPNDLVVDEGDGTVYRVDGVSSSVGLGLDFVGASIIAAS